jgi:hypothetical protein
MKKLYALALLCAMAIGAHSQNLVQDSSFEAGTPSSAWTESSTNFGTPLCDSGCGTCNGSCLPRTGYWYAWFGGIQQLEIGKITQTVTIPTAPNATWQFYLKIPYGDGSGNDSLVARIDGNNLKMWSDTDSAAYLNYTLVQINASAYANNASHVLELYGSVHGPRITNFLVDDISLRLVPLGGVYEYFLSAGINLFPNPANTFLNVQFTEPERHQGDLIEMYSETGSKIYSRTYDTMENTIGISLNDLANGIYFVKITGTHGSMHSSQFIVNH